MDEIEGDFSWVLVAWIWQKRASSGHEFMPVCCDSSMHQVLSVAAGWFWCPKNVADYYFSERWRCRCANSICWTRKAATAEYVSYLLLQYGAAWVAFTYHLSRVAFSGNWFT